jgi:hypothetical protein
MGWAMGSKGRAIGADRALARSMVPTWPNLTMP